MFYQIADNGASIRFTGDSGEQLIMKKDIQEVRILREDMIECKIGHPLRNIFFRYGDVTAPTVDSATNLRDAINTMITGCVCSGSGTGAGNPPMGR